MSPAFPVRSISEEGLVSDRRGEVDLDQAPLAALAHGDAGHAQRNRLVREGECHLVSAPADASVGPSRRCPGLERQALRLRENDPLGLRATGG